jgi:hypothetical protein
MSLCKPDGFAYHESSAFLECLFAFAIDIWESFMLGNVLISGVGSVVSLAGLLS